jgi:hypothetical protein
VDGEVHLDLIGPWTILTSRPWLVPGLMDLPELSMDLQIHEVCTVREDRIESVKIGFPHPHLLVYLASRKVLFVNGYDQRYECWQVAVSPGRPD